MTTIFTLHGNVKCLSSTHIIKITNIRVIIILIRNKLLDLFFVLKKYLRFLTKTLKVYKKLSTTNYQNPQRWNKFHRPKQRSGKSQSTLFHRSPPTPRLDPPRGVLSRSRFFLPFTSRHKGRDVCVVSPVNDFTNY